MGQNVLSAALEFGRVLATDPAAPRAGDNGGSVYFDIWGQAMVRCACCRGAGMLLPSGFP